MASKTPGGGGGFGRGSSGSSGGGGGKPKKPKVTKEDAMKKHPAGKGLPNQGAKAKVYDFRTGKEVKPSAPVKRTLASDAKKVAKSPRTKAAGGAVAVGAGYAKLRANDKARQQKMITIKNQWEKSAAKKSGMTLNEYIKKYGK
jgi:hypothetical protein